MLTDFEAGNFQGSELHDYIDGLQAVINSLHAAIDDTWFNPGG